MNFSDRVVQIDKLLLEMLRLSSGFSHLHTRINILDVDFMAYFEGYDRYFSSLNYSSDMLEKKSLDGLVEEIYSQIIGGKALYDHAEQCEVEVKKRDEGIEMWIKYPHIEERE